MAKLSCLKLFETIFFLNFEFATHAKHMSTSHSYVFSYVNFRFRYRLKFQTALFLKCYNFNHIVTKFIFQIATQLINQLKLCPRQTTLLMTWYQI